MPDDPNTGKGASVAENSVIGLRLIAGALLFFGYVMLPVSLFWTLAPLLPRNPFGYSLFGPLVGIPTFVLAVIALRYAWRLRARARAEATTDTSELSQRQRRFVGLIIFTIGILWLVVTGGCVLSLWGISSIEELKPQNTVDMVSVLVNGLIATVIGIVICALGQAIADTKQTDKPNGQ